MGPVRVGNDAWRQVQHDVYGSAVLAATHALLRRAARSHRATSALFERLEPLGRRAVAHARPTRCRPVGVARQRARAHVLERDVLGRLRSPRAHRRRGSASPTARPPGVPRRTASRPSSARTAGTRNAARSSPRWPATRTRREPAAAGRPQLRARRRPTLRRYGRGDRARPDARRLRVSLCRARRLRRARERVHRLHVLAT